MSDFVIGLTGGIGSGKTQVSDYFAKLGIDIVDADICSRIVVEPGKPALEEIVNRFSHAILDKTGNLNRAKLRKIIFKDPGEKQWLESLLHPLIFEEIMGQLQAASSPYAILVSPLLVEAGQNHFCQRVLVVDVPEDIQLARTMQRDDNSEEQVKAIMASQASRQQRIDYADDIISNDSNLESLYRKVDELHQRYLEYATQASS